MKRSLLLLVGATIAATAFGSGSVSSVKGDAVKGKAIGSTVCAACHAVDGNSSGSPNPKLAGQHAEYLFKQMQNFKSVDGKPPVRNSPIMNGMIASFDDAQMRDLAAYFAAQKLTANQEKQPENFALGKKLYQAGNASKGLPACAGCHGPTGAGIPVEFPRIGGQLPEYIESQLKAFRDDTRTNDPGKMMRLVAVKMNDEEIKAVANFVANLH